jgi:hypothetical protein
MESRNCSNEGKGVKMFRLRDLKNGLFQIHKSNGPAFEGTPRSLFAQAVKMGIPERELSKAVNALHTYHDHYADFDDYGNFKYSKRNK